jgi:pimeloyl-ACP methyl ester carboxylesterase
MNTPSIERNRAMSDALASRRLFLQRAAGLAGLALPALQADAVASLPSAAQRVSTDLIEFAYFAAGPEHGRPVVLVHDFGYGIESFARTAPLLAAAGLRVLAPQLRGHGATRFHDQATPRSGQQAALGKDLIDFIDALHIPEAVFAGFGWGAHAAFAASVVRPTRCVGLVLAGIERIDEARPLERYLFASGAGQRELDRRRRGLAREAWRRLSPRAPFDSALFERIAPALDNPDYVRILTHAWLGRHAPLDPLAAPDPRYAALEKRFAPAPATTVAALSLSGGASGLAPAAGPAIAYGGFHARRDLAGVGHHLPYEAPLAYAGAVLDLVHAGKRRT